MGYRGQRARREEELASPSATSAATAFVCPIRRTATGFSWWCGLFLVAIVAASCSSTIENHSPDSGVLTVGVPEGTVASPGLGARQLARDYFALEGLTQLSPDGRVQPRLAESWSWENGGTRLKIVLRDHVQFHNGAKLTGALAAEVLRDIAGRPNNRALYPSFNTIASISPAGPREIAIDLSEPSRFLLEDLSVPLEIGRDIVGTGPYRVARRSGTTLFLERFKPYYLGQPAIDRVIIQPFDALRTTWTSLLRGQVDMVTDVPPESVEFIRNDEIQVISFARWYQYLVAFNIHHPAFSSPVVRRALNLAIDRDALIERALKGHGAAATGPLWPKHWAYDASAPHYTFDQTTAMALLDAAGLRAGSAPVGHGFPGARLRFTCLVPADFAVLERLALELQRQLYDIGVDVQFESVPITQYDARIRDGKFEAVLVDMISGPTLGRPYIFWRSSNESKGLNVFGYEDREAERLFRLLGNSESEAAVRSATSRLQRVLLEDPPALFLAWNERARAVRREFRVYQDPGRDPLLTMWRWTPATMMQTAALR